MVCIIGDSNAQRNQIQNKIKATLCQKNKPVLVTGSSLGGALANLAAVDLRLHGCSVELVTFGKWIAYTPS